MSKRKAGVNDIIYELDNDDIEISSEDEAKEAKINRVETKPSETNLLPEHNDEENASVVISDDATVENILENISETNNDNGGKTALETTDNNINYSQVNVISVSPKADETESEVDSNKKLDMDGSKTTIYNEDIIIDSPASNSDLGVVGCENRIPLVTVRFRDRKLASTYKNKLKAFMLSLIKLHEKESPNVDSETDLELDIWPEDLNDEDSFEEKSEANQDNLFFIDTDPCSNNQHEVPRYRNVSTIISNHEDKEPSPPPVLRRGPTCFNCDGAHPLRDCTLPKNGARIAEKRKQMVPRVGRYHVEDEQKYGHLIPGRISGQLRHALGLKRHEIPRHIYRMRLLGYPPGWLEEARISHSGITMFDSTGAAILDPEEEEGEVCEPGSKDKFDIKKILDFPGFNVPASSRYKEESHLLGMPPMSEQDSKIAMLQMLAPNAMKAYKRKRLTLFPSASANASAHEVAEMDLDSGDEIADFPSVPPLPDEAPLPPPPPPPPESPEPPPPGLSPVKCTSPAEPAPPLPADVPPAPSVPVPPDSPNVPAQRDKAKSEANSGYESPSLVDLEQKKKLLLDALQGDGDDISLNISELNEAEDENIDNKLLEETQAQEGSEESQEPEKEYKSELTIDVVKAGLEDNTKDISPGSKESVSPAIEDSTKKSVSTPESKAGHVKTTLYGTPVMNVASPYVKLPSDVNFAKDICDVINFENLPNSTGKYKQISNILKRVKNEVDRIQDS